MKKILIVLAGAFSLAVSAQTTILIKNTANSSTLIANDTVYLTTQANLATQVVFDLKNLSATDSNTYKVKREDVLLNPGSSAYFCFAGSCFPDVTTTSPDADTLAPGQSASQVAGSYKMLTTDLEEGQTVGRSIVRYTVFNTDHPTDTIRFTLKYNFSYTGPVGIRETNKVFSSFEIFPNPAKETASILINSPKAFESSVVVFNSLGQIVYQKEISLSEGKNKIDVNVQNLKAGVYFTSIKTGNTTISKKLIIN